MHILITTFTFPPQANGVAHVAYEHAVRFLQRGYRVTVATGFHPERQFYKFPHGMEVVQFRISGNANIRSRYKGELDAYEEYISSFQGDIICCHCWQIWSTDLAIRRFQDSKAVKILVSHGVSANSKSQWPKTILSWLLWRPYVWLEMPRIIKAFDHIVVLSDKNDLDRFYDNYLVDRMGYGNISVIPNGMDLLEFSKELVDFKAKYDLGGQYLLLCVGKFSREKNEEMLLRAFIKSELKEATLILIGPKKNDYSLGLEKLWHKHTSNISNKRLIILENLSREEILSAYRAADLYLNSSRTECFPLVILEAMASRTPFLSTDVGCVSSLPGGITVSSTNEMSQKMVEILSNPQSHKKLGCEGREACERNYSWDYVINKYAELFRYMLSRKPANDGDEGINDVRGQ